MRDFLPIGLYILHLSRLEQREKDTPTRRQMTALFIYLVISRLVLPTGFRGNRRGPDDKVKGSARLLRKWKEQLLPIMFHEPLPIYGRDTELSIGRLSDFGEEPFRHKHLPANEGIFKRQEVQSSDKVGLRRTIDRASKAKAFRV